jgi:hypothetical protein
MRLNPAVAVAAVNVALAAALAWLWSDDSRGTWREPAPLAPALEEVAAVEAPEAPEVSRYRETIERPLFLASRRPGPKKDPGGEAQEAVELRDVKLLGTYGSGDKAGIIVSRGGKAERVAVGSSIGQWKVAGGEGRSVTLQRASGERRTLELTLNTAAPPESQGKPEEAKSEVAPAAGAAAPAPSAAAAPPRRPGQVPRGTAGGASQSARGDSRRSRFDRINAARARQQASPPLPE